jgi:hypothetical protein
MMTAEITNKLSTTGLEWLDRVRLRAQRRVLWMQALWSNQLTDAERGLMITPDQVNCILTDPQAMAEAEATFYQTDPSARQLSQAIQDTDEKTTQNSRWQQLRQVFGVSTLESDLLSLALAAELEPFLRRVYGYLHDDATLDQATPWLAAALFQWPGQVHFGAESALVRWRLAYPKEQNHQPWSWTAAWVADPFIAAWLMQGQRLDPALGNAVQWIAATASAHPLCLYPDQLAAMQTFIRDMGCRVGLEAADQPPSMPLVLELIGSTGTGKQTLTTQLCESLGTDLIAVDASALLAPEVPLALASERLMRTMRMARLTGAVLYWQGIETTPPQPWQGLESCPLMVLGTPTPLEPGYSRSVRKVLTLPTLTQHQRIELWQWLTDFVPVPDPIVNWVLTPAEITAAAQVTPAGVDAVVESCQQRLHQGANALFAPLVCPYTKQDIVLPDTLRQHLDELEQQARLRWSVYEELGFERLCPMGRGITALFAGPSGTGKTMAAQVLARSLGMALYRVDLSGVVNKYIGETEKRLKRVFDACERANVVLFFDEADALFGQRTQVKDAHDRFANIEIDYLLQRMEQFDGLAILATNRKGDLDQAFLRRIRFIVDFVQPGPAERLQIWKLALAERSPAGEPLLEGIDWPFLAERLNLTGADIKAAALGAAFLARAAGTRISMRHVLHAAQREMTKQGVVLRSHDWEGWQDSKVQGSG